MAILDLLIISGAALFIEKIFSDKDDNKDERISEWERWRAVNQKRKATPCFFKDGISAEEFKKIALHVGEKHRRVKNISVKGPVIYCTVESQTGNSNWDFNVDFNNWGHITGTYWSQTDNDDSSIPKHYGDMVSEEIHNFLSSRSIVLEEFSDYVDANEDLETPQGLQHKENNSHTNGKIKKKENSIVLRNALSELLHEHLYPIISKLKAWGFKNIKTTTIKDVNANNNHFIFEGIRFGVLA